MVHLCQGLEHELFFLCSIKEQRCGQGRMYWRDAVKLPATFEDGAGMNFGKVWTYVIPGEFL